ncbi:soluble quino protein glucose dehydrogenase [Microthyrium microscopicum]|uniref:Soluble quino protein glucose dehydrogenase n=1 Tax=Microthyrium microscopicum TaxID=703497 RepID=A0A6A6U6A1_9PEZI|nr:soluble quino protein glucose dehydrogenase [Microthyrium microscopicum]
MLGTHDKSSFTLISLLITKALAQSSCSIPTSTAKYPAPSLASGYTARIIANGFQRPRSIIFDSEGHLLVVEAGKGITALTLNDAGGSCIGISSKATVIADTSLNHGIEMSPDGTTLYASNSDKAMRWAYDPKATKTNGNATILVQGMDNSDHTTRTILLSKKVNNTLLISRGSNENIDAIAADINSGHSQIRSFDIGGDTNSLNYATEGTRLGWGLRNSVGVAEHPASGGIYSVENSADNVDRDKEDIHNNNPGEEMNFHGYLNGTKANPDVQGGNYGYPNCYAAWNVSEIPQAGTLQTGSQFEIGDTINDKNCSSPIISPTLTFPAHWAPLDMKFNKAGSVAWITSHGSWNRQPPSGYLLYAVPFTTSGEPIASSNSTNSWQTIMSNPDNTKCPGSCFRPVGLAFDSKGRLFMTSDATGEIYVITATNGTGVDTASIAVDGSDAGGHSGSGSGAKTGEASTGGVNLALVCGIWALMMFFETG